MTRIAKRGQEKSRRGVNPSVEQAFNALCLSNFHNLPYARGAYRRIAYQGLLMEDYVPMLQSLLWIVTALGLVFMFRAEIKLMREVFAKR